MENPSTGLINSFLLEAMRKRLDAGLEELFVEVWLPLCLHLQRSLVILALSYFELIDASLK